jgi:hypothetical protein
VARYQLDNVATAVLQASAAHRDILTPLLALVLGRLRSGWQLLQVNMALSDRTAVPA